MTPEAAIRVPAKRARPRVRRLVADPLRSAHLAGLRYVRDDGAGIRRRRVGRGVLYVAADGRRVRDPATLARMKRLAIPPAWRDVWICPSEHGHLQASGRDARGRKQYRYHARWRAVRDETKYARMIAFAAALPAVRARVAADLQRAGLPREKVLATVVRLLETTLIRIGNEEYARANGSFGLTTLRTHHVNIDGATMTFEFRGKGGRRHRVDVNDGRLARVVARCQDLPGQELFQYLDADGERRSVDSGDVNAYLREASGEDFTAKDFRTWAGTVLAALALRELPSATSKAQAKGNVLRAVEGVARTLGNTPAVCRKGYIHPAVIETYLEGGLADALRGRLRGQCGRARGLGAEEATVLALLREGLGQSRAA
jgi:DNA topoisomerase-1